MLVGGWATPLKNMKLNWDDDIPNIWQQKKNGNQTTQQNAIGWAKITRFLKGLPFWNSEISIEKFPPRWTTPLLDETLRLAPDMEVSYKSSIFTGIVHDKSTILRAVPQGFPIFIDIARPRPPDWPPRRLKEASKNWPSEATRVSLLRLPRSSMMM